MSYLDRKNILAEGLIDKLIGLLTKKKKLKGLSKEERKAYDALAANNFKGTSCKDLKDFRLTK